MTRRAGFASWGLGLAVLTGCAAPRTAPLATLAPPTSPHLERGVVVAIRPLDAATQQAAAPGIQAVMAALGLAGATVPAPAQEVVVRREDGDAMSFIAVPPNYALGEHVIFNPAGIQRD